MWKFQISMQIKFLCSVDGDLKWTLRFKFDYNFRLKVVHLLQTIYFYQNITTLCLNKVRKFCWNLTFKYFRFHVDLLLTCVNLKKLKFYLNWIEVQLCSNSFLRFVSYQMNIIISYKPCCFFILWYDKQYRLNSFSSHIHSWWRYVHRKCKKWIKLICHGWLCIKTF